MEISWVILQEGEAVGHARTGGIAEVTENLLSRPIVFSSDSKNCHFSARGIRILTGKEYMTRAMLAHRIPQAFAD
jgi:hypothetical protein